MTTPPTQLVISEQEKLLKTKAWPDGRKWPAQIVLYVGSNMPMDVYGLGRLTDFGVLYIRHDVAQQQLNSQREAIIRECADIAANKFNYRKPDNLQQMAGVAIQQAILAKITNK